MKKLFSLSFGLIFFFGISSSVFAQTVDDFFNFGNYPVNYDPPYQITRGQKRPESIDKCLEHKEFHFNELHNIWVRGLARCKINKKNVLSKADANAVSEDPKDEDACKGRRERQIILHGTPSEDDARFWADHCSYLGALGGASPVTGSKQPPSGGVNIPRPGPSYGGTPSSGGIPYSGGFTPSQSSRTVDGRSVSTMTDVEIFNYLLGKRQASGTESTEERNRLVATFRSSGSTAGVGDFESVYTGTGVKVPDASLVAKGISKEQSLIKLIVFYTNATLPYVSVISVFAFVSAGLYYILSFTNEELNSKAKSMMMYVVIGIIIIFSAYTIVNTLLRFAEFQ